MGAEVNVADNSGASAIFASAAAGAESITDMLLKVISC
jgi:hypothetical protein